MRTRTSIARAAALGLALATTCAGIALGANAGDPDPSFHDDGTVTLPFGIWPAHVLAQADGKIVMTDSDSFTVVRLNADGTPDRGFGGDGIVTADFGAGAKITAAALQPDGKLLVAGQAASGPAVARFNLDGSPDPTFGPGGPDGDGRRVYPEIRHGADAMLVEPAETIVLVGGSTSGITGSRLEAGGAVDATTFERAGDSNGNIIRSGALTPDGKIVVAGYSATPGSAGWNAVVARFNANGTLDKTLAGTGSIEIGDTNRDELPATVLVQPDNKIILAGETRAGETRMTVTRLDETGTLDATFGQGGTATPGFIGDDYGAGAALQPDGKILIAGTSASEGDFAIARFDANGNLDQAFGIDGKATVPFDEAAAASAAGLQPDGRLVIAGVTAAQGRIRTGVARILTAPTPRAGEPTSDPGPRAVVPRCAGKAATIVGTAGRDTLRGTRRSDVIVALGGNDRVLAGRGRDLVCGGRGNDRISGGPGNDRLRGELGRDTLLGGAGKDRLRGGAGADRCRGGAGRDTVNSCGGRGPRR